MLSRVSVHLIYLCLDFFPRQNQVDKKGWWVFSANITTLNKVLQIKMSSSWKLTAVLWGTAKGSREHPLSQWRRPNPPRPKGAAQTLTWELFLCCFSLVKHSAQKHRKWRQKWIWKSHDSNQTTWLWIMALQLTKLCDFRQMMSPSLNSLVYKWGKIIVSSSLGRED